MNGWQRFEELARRARGEPIPPIEITARVMAALVLRPAVALRPERNWPLAVLAGLSILAASIMMAVTIDTWSWLLDPPASVLQPLSWILP